jgi:hypothetical protein
MRQWSFMVEHAAKVAAIGPAAARLASHEVIGIGAVAANWFADELAARDRSILEEIVRHFGHRHFRCIAGRARRSGTAACTGTRSFPLRMVLADPSVIIAARAVSHANTSHPNASITRLNAGCRRFFTLIQPSGAIGAVAALELTKPIRKRIINYMGSG